jgi:chromosome segregation ATPase
MFSAIGRFFRALGYLFTGKIDSAGQSIKSNPHAVQATYDRVIEEKRKRIHQYKDAVAAMIAQEEKKKAELTKQSEEVARLQKLKDGAAAMARKLVEKHNGNIEAVKHDPEYQKCQAAFKDFRSTLEEKEARCAELEADIRQLQETVAGHKLQLEGIMRELEKIKQEKHETVADLITSKEEKEISDMISGIADDRTSRELEELRQLRAEAKAGARVSREMSGMDHKRTEEEFLAYAAQDASDDEFDRLIGLTRDSGEPAAPSERTKIPEG